MNPAQQFMLARLLREQCERAFTCQHIKGGICLDCCAGLKWQIDTTVRQLMQEAEQHSQVFDRTSVIDVEATDITDNPADETKQNTPN